MVLTTAAALGASACAAEGPKPASAGQWTSPVLGKALTTELYVPGEGTGGAHRGRRAGIVYLRNLRFSRVSAEPDAPIIADFVKEGYLVLVIDYGKDAKAVAPYINHDFRVLRSALGGKTCPFAPQKVLPDATFILPEGYRLLRDVTYCGELGKGEVFQMDIRYPSKPARPAPAVMQIPVENGCRMGNWAHYTYNEVMAEGFLTRGYAAVQADNPIKKYKGVDYMPEIAIKLKAAVRTLRANAKRCNIDADRIGVMGFSRSSGQAGILAMSGGIKELEQGPNLEYSSRVQVALLHAGRMDHLGLLQDSPKMAETYQAAFGDPVKNRKVWEEHSAISYVTPDDPPTFLSVGGKDEYRVAQIARMAEALKKAGVEYKHEITPGMGHQVTGDLQVLTDIYEFFDKHLKPGKKN